MGWLKVTCGLGQGWHQKVFRELPLRQKGQRVSFVTSVRTEEDGVG